MNGEQQLFESLQRENLFILAPRCEQAEIQPLFHKQPRELACSFYICYPQGFLT